MVQLTIHDEGKIEVIEIDDSIFMGVDEDLEYGYKDGCMTIEDYIPEEYPRDISLPQAYLETPPKRLEDIELPDPGDWPYDEKITPLVRALRGLGLYTVGSCEGHLDEKYKDPFPWVTVFNAILVEDLHDLIKFYNKFSDVEWKIQNTYTIRPLNVPETEEELKKIQKNSVDFAEFLFHSFYDT